MPSGPLKWKKQLVKNVRILLQFTEVIKIVRLSSPLLVVLRLSSPRSVLRQGRRLALLSKSNPKSVYSVLRSVAGSSSSFSSYSNFPNCSSSRESASVFAHYLKSYFSVPQPKTQRSRARSYLSEFRQATCSEESHSPFCSPFSPAKFLAAATNLSLSTATGPDKVAYLMLKHLPRSGINFLLHIFNLFFHLEDIFHYYHL